MSSQSSLRVDNLAPSVTSEQLLSVFEGIGPVRKAFVVEKEGKPAGYGIVVYALPADAEEAAIKLNRTEVNGRQVKVMLSRSKRKTIDAETGKPSTKRARSLPTKLTVEAIQLLARTVAVWTESTPDVASKWVTKCCGAFALQSVAFPSPTAGRFATDSSVGHAIFATAKDAKKAARKIDRQKLGGSIMLARRLASLARTPKALSECRVIVRNLGFATTDAMVRAVFEKIGPLHSIVLPSAKTKDGGVSKRKVSFRVHHMTEFSTILMILFN